MGIDLTLEFHLITQFMDGSYKYLFIKNYKTIIGLNCIFPYSKKIPLPGPCRPPPFMEE